MFTDLLGKVAHALRGGTSGLTCAHGAMLLAQADVDAFGPVLLRTSVQWCRERCQRDGLEIFHFSLNEGNASL